MINNNKINVHTGDFDGLGALIPGDTNIVYHHQCGSNMCNQHQLEGSLIAIDTPEKLVYELIILHQPDSYFSLEELEKIQTIIDKFNFTIDCFKNTLRLKLDSKTSCYGWLVLQRENKTGNYVLIWENDD